MGNELEAAIPLMPQWKYASLLVRLTAAETERVLGVSLDGSTHELRKRAMLLVLARMGLPACEFTHLMLAELDWAQGWVRIRPGDSHRERRQASAPDDRSLSRKIARSPSQTSVACLTCIIFRFLKRALTLCLR